MAYLFRFREFALEARALGVAFGEHAAAHLYDFREAHAFLRNRVGSRESHLALHHHMLLLDIIGRAAHVHFVERL